MGEEEIPKNTKPLIIEMKGIEYDISKLERLQKNKRGEINELPNIYGSRNYNS